MVGVQRWEKKTVLIVVKTYPSPANKGVEVSCTAAITENREWVRIFPIPHRLLADGKKFRKYQWIEAELIGASDHRPESHKINVDSIRILSEPMPTKDNWQARREFLEPLRAHCLCCLMQQQQSEGSPTLGWFKPGQILGFTIRDDAPHWSPSELSKLNQPGLFDAEPLKTLEKIPFKFIYRFRCDHSYCKGHKLSCTDWELAESYRKWKRVYGIGWKQKFLEQYRDKAIRKWDTHFFVGTVSNHPNSWIIVGLFYPPFIEDDKNNGLEQMRLL